MTPQPTEPGAVPATPVRCAVCGRWRPKGGRWLTTLDPGSRSAPVVCGMRCARAWPGPVPLPSAGRRT